MFGIGELPRCAFDWWSRCSFEYPSVLVFAVLAAFAYGACLGSFMNVCIWRMPRRESVVSAPSHCTNCGARIKWYDNLPVISYLVLRGRCRVCRQPYSARYFVVETLTGLLFVAEFLKAGLAGQHPGAIYFYYVLTLLAVGATWIDAEHRIVPDALNFPAMLLALAGALAMPGAWGTNKWWKAGALCLASGAIPGAFLWIFAAVGAGIAGREVLGRGDVKLAVAIGMLCGLPGAVFALTAGSLTGTLWGLAECLAHREKPAQASVAFGPFLATAAAAWIFIGDEVLRLAAAVSNYGG